MVVSQTNMYETVFGAHVDLGVSAWSDQERKLSAWISLYYALNQFRHNFKNVFWHGATNEIWTKFSKFFKLVKRLRMRQCE